MNRYIICIGVKDKNTVKRSMHLLVNVVVDTFFALQPFDRDHVHLLVQLVVPLQQCPVHVFTVRVMGGGPVPVHHKQRVHSQLYAQILKAAVRWTVLQKLIGLNLQWDVALVLIEVEMNQLRNLHG